MTRFESNATVKSGYYFNPIAMKIVPVARDGERLPNEKGSWLAIPTVAALALTPLLGALFLMFLPMIGFVLFAHAAGVKVASLFKGGAGELVVPGYAPGMAHLTGKEAGAEKKEGEAKAAPELEKLSKEIEDKRR
ncbi:MAG TPA: hypothetical protein VLT61_16915 [Anaeromyxobacteraceae bacterium]|nr:hypothetical protein [Anaeromyxobacteraceae bacterium]